LEEIDPGLEEYTFHLEDVDSLARSVLQIDEDVKDRLNVEVILESLGISDEVAKGYGYPSLSSLSEAVLELVNYYRRVSMEGVGGADKGRGRVRSILKGVLAASPWIVMLLSLTLTGVSLWSLTRMTLEFATMIGLALFASLIVTGGITQAGTRKFLYYIYQENPALATHVLKKYFIYGGLVILSSAALLHVLNTALNLYPAPYQNIFTIYYVSLSILWLSLAPLYALRKTLHITLIFIAALGVMYIITSQILSLLMMDRLTLIIHAQNIGILLAAAMFIIATATYLYIAKGVKGRGGKGVGEVKPPRGSILLYESIPYILAGLLYFTFLLMDRIVAWSLGGPFILWYPNRYEVGVDLALFTLVPLIGVIEYHLLGFSEEILKLGEDNPGMEIEDFREKVRRLYKRGMATLLLTGIVTVIVIQYLGGAFKALGVNTPLSGFLAQYGVGGRETLSVFTVSSIGYLFLSLYLANSLYCFYLYRPRPVVATLALGVTLNLSIGYILSRSLGLEYAVYGFLAGSLYLAILSTYYLWRLLNRFDAYYYMAY